ncbi:hypothetical protein FN846DRAFT_908627 [Sphaerosporella brunnea]|uniref:Uncharacterized protein n=1 Tax=Sphaerosporella brunnea TaxID=1250544 RepID=A0A5J5ESW1_9PEZI|nr:hypothetical protein FN846DRAFT_908627 [Sphaerosporella brunnea]
METRSNNASKAAELKIKKINSRNKIAVDAATEDSMIPPAVKASSPSETPPTTTNNTHTNTQCRLTGSAPATSRPASRRLAQLPSLINGGDIDKIKPHRIEKRRFRYALSAAEIQGLPLLFRATRNYPEAWGVGTFHKLLPRQPWPKGTVKATIDIFTGAKWVFPGEALRIGAPESFGVKKQEEAEGKCRVWM